MDIYLLLYFSKRTYSQQPAFFQGLSRTEAAAELRLAPNPPSSDPMRGASQTKLVSDSRASLGSRALLKYTRAIQTLHSSKHIHHNAIQDRLQRQTYQTNDWPGETTTLFSRAFGFCFGSGGGGVVVFQEILRGRKNLGREGMLKHPNYEEDRVSVRF
jgi:hypothetical protein